MSDLQFMSNSLYPHNLWPRNADCFATVPAQWVKQSSVVSLGHTGMACACMNNDIIDRWWIGGHMGPW